MHGFVSNSLFLHLSSAQQLSSGISKRFHHPPSPVSHQRGSRFKCVCVSILLQLSGSLLLWEISILVPPHPWLGSSWRLRSQHPPPPPIFQRIMWPKIWRRCALWPSCAKQRCWRTCGQGPCWDRRCWCLQGYQETLQTGCPCEPVPCDRQDSARRGNRRPRWQSEGAVSYRESQCRRGQHNPAQVMLRCCRQSRRGSGSIGERREQHCLVSAEV